MKLVKTTIVIVVILSVVLPYLFEPLTANAQDAGLGIGSIIRGGAVCIASGQVSKLIVDWIQIGITKLFNWLATNTSISKDFLAGLYSKFFPGFGWSDAVPTNDERTRTEISTKEKILDVVARCFARSMFDDLTARMVGAVRTSGRDLRGGKPTPAFVRDWRKFLSNAQYRGENIFRSILSSTTLCNHLSNETRTLFRANNQPNITRNTNIRVGNLDPFTLRARCTMAQGWTTQRYASDFAGNGGYSALYRLAQPQNNAYGLLLLSLGEVATQRAIEEIGDNSEASSNGSFTSRRSGPGSAGTCGSQPSYGQCFSGGICTYTRSGSITPITVASGCFDNTDCVARFCSNSTNVCTTNAQCNPSDACLLRSLNNQCVVYKEILTPGSILMKSVEATIQQDLAWITNIDEWNEWITSLIYRIVMPRILNLSEPTKYRQEQFPTEDIESPDFNSPDWPDLGAGPSPTPTPGPVCGDLTCDPTIGEDFATCPQDCTTQGVILWAGDAMANLSGTWEQFTNDDPDLSNNRIGAGTTSAIQVTPGVSVEVCTGINYTGTCETFTFGSMAINQPTISSDDDLTNNTIGDNTIASIRILTGPNPGTSQCTDGLDNDSDGLTDYPADPGCKDAADNDEITYQILVCDRVSSLGICDSNAPNMMVTADIPDLSATAVGNNQATYLEAGCVIYGTCLLEVCSDINFTGTCVSITGPMLDGNRFSPPKTNGWMTLDEIGLDNDVESIRMTQQ